MKKITLVFAFFITVLIAQATLIEYNNTGLRLTTQAEVDACSNILGTVLYLEIVGSSDLNNPYSIKNLDALKGITSVGGVTLTLGTIKDIRGLGNITSIEGDLYISGATYINDLSKTSSDGGDAFPKLVSIGGNLTIYGNPDLLNISGFFSLRFVKGWINISGNHKLTGISGFNILSNSSDINIEQNGNLIDISGFTNLISIDSSSIFVQGNLGIHENNLKFISGFGNLKSVNRLNIHETALEELSCFKHLENAGTIDISQNGLLKNIKEFDALINCKYLVFSLNPNLETIPSFNNLVSCGSLSIGGGGGKIKNISGFKNLNYCGSLGIFPSSDLISITGFDKLSNWGSIGIYTNNLNAVSLSIASNLNSTTLDVEKNRISFDNVTICSMPWVCAYNPYYIPNSFNCDGSPFVGCTITTLDKTVKSDNEFLYYPVPAKDILNFNRFVSYRIYNSQQTELLSGNGSNVSVLDLPSGLYFLNVNNTISKFIKE